MEQYQDHSTDHSNEEPNLFWINGRIGRLRFIAYHFGWFITFFSLILIFFGMFAPIVSLVLSICFFIIILLLPLSLFYLSSIWTIKRLHDFGLSGLFFILIFLVSAYFPLVGILIWFCMILIPGSKEENRFGLTPSKNHLGIYCLSSIPVLGTFFFISFSMFALLYMQMTGQDTLVYRWSAQKEVGAILQANLAPLYKAVPLLNDLF